MPDIDIADAVNKILADYYREVNVKLENGLNKAADRLVEEFEQSPLTPDNPETSENKYRKSFKVKRQYKKHRYVGSTKTVKNGGEDVPLSNMLEYGVYAQPHMRQIYDGVEKELGDIVIIEIKK